MLTLIYAIIVALRNKWYDRHTPPKHPIPIISIGNISTGGTGKTPFVIYLCNLLKSLNYKPNVIGRGYKRKSKNDIVVSDGETILADVNEAGDEMLLVARKAEVPVFAGNSKSKLAQKISDKYRAKTNQNRQVIIVDDGFQHRKLHRDLDIVLVDNKTLSTMLLPLGRLREPFSSLRRADIIILTKGASLQQLQLNYSEKQPVFEVSQAFATPYLLTANNLDLQQTKQHRMIALTGIANPATFLDMIKNENYQIAKHIKKSDHFYYKSNDVVKICEECTSTGCNCIATTEKDAVKLAGFSEIFQRYNITIVVFPIEISLIDESKIIEIIKLKLQQFG